MITSEERVWTRPDRRRRNAHNPTVALTLNVDKDLLVWMNDTVVARGGTRSGLIRIAVERLKQDIEDGKYPPPSDDDGGR